MLLVKKFEETMVSAVTHAQTHIMQIGQSTMYGIILSVYVINQQDLLTSPNSMVISRLEKEGLP